MHSSVHAVALAQAGARWELLGRPPPLNASSIAELQCLCEVEQQFKRLQMEHDMHSNHALENGRSQASLLARAVQRER